MAGDELALDLETDDEEEHDHQRIVDPVLERERERVGPDRDPDLRVVEAEVRVRPRRVRPQHSGDRARQKDRAARDLRVNEPVEDVARSRPRRIASHSMEGSGPSGSSQSSTPRTAPYIGTLPS